MGQSAGNVAPLDGLTSRFQIIQSYRKQGAGAGEGNRTLVVSLEGFCSTIELHPPESGLYPHNRLNFPVPVRRRHPDEPTCCRPSYLVVFGGGGRIRTFEGRAVRFTV